MKGFDKGRRFVYNVYMMKCGEKNTWKEAAMVRVFRWSLLVMLVSAVPLLSLAEKSVGKHLFILSGQSNMARLDPSVSFTPMLEKAYGAESIIVVKEAQGGQPLYRWYKQWESSDGKAPEKRGDIYDLLMEKVQRAIDGQEIATVTFFWMQGERDAREKWGDVYGKSLAGMFSQLEADLGRDDVRYVLGRLSDFDMEQKRYPHWKMVRETLVSVAESRENAAWVNTDDLNGPNDDLHYTPEGYAELGRRFGRKAVSFLEAQGFSPKNSIQE